MIDSMGPIYASWDVAFGSLRIAHGNYGQALSGPELAQARAILPLPRLDLTKRIRISASGQEKPRGAKLRGYHLPDYWRFRTGRHAAFFRSA